MSTAAGSPCPGDLQWVQGPGCDRNTAQSSARAVTLSPLVWTSWGWGGREGSGSKESTARGTDPGSTLSRNDASEPTRHPGQGQKRVRERLPRPQLQTGGPAAGAAPLLGAGRRAVHQEPSVSRSTPPGPPVLLCSRHLGRRFVVFLRRLPSWSFLAAFSGMSSSGKRPKDRGRPSGLRAGLVLCACPTSPAPSFVQGDPV